MTDYHRRSKLCVQCPPNSRNRYPASDPGPQHRHQSATVAFVSLLTAIVARLRFCVSRWWAGGEEGLRRIHGSMSQHPVWLTRLALGGAALLVVGVTTYDIHRSIEANRTPPTEAQVAALAVHIEESRQSGSKSEFKSQHSR